MSKAEFIKNFRTARNLFVHGPIRAGVAPSPAAFADEALARTAIWLTPKSVAGFDVNDFPEMPDQKRANLQKAIEDYLQAVDQINPIAGPTPIQFAQAATHFAQLLRLLEPYLYYPDEVATIEQGLATMLPLPEWIVNWDFELLPDTTDEPAVYLTYYVDETQAPIHELGKEASLLTSKLHRMLRTNGLDRSPYVNFRGVAEYRRAG